MCVALCDGRVLVGRFSCFDKQQNVLLREVREQRLNGTPDSSAASLGSPDSERHLGCVLVPWKCITACHAMDVS